ncbi:MAG: alkylhydroperoxidase-related (seleno)protein, partial [Rhodospirillaceae bacterium]|nr:alkylhydroperoxidase-related (seleno)protein [Rhodospirillaceae bacterium]
MSVVLIEVIHRVATDQSRLTRAFFEEALSNGLSDGEYVETVGVIATALAVDGFTRALGMPCFELPEPVAGAPHRTRPPGARTGRAWVPTVAPEYVTETEAGLYDGLGGANIHRALSLVPDEVIGFFHCIDAAQY